jgi:hypothetical protein
MNAKVIARATKLFSLAEKNTNANEAQAARDAALSLLDKNGMSEKLYRTIMKYRR